MSKKLKPCPFCGIDAGRLIDKTDISPWFARQTYVECQACFARSGDYCCESETFSHYDEMPTVAIKSWNDRIDAEKDAKIKAAEAAEAEIERRGERIGQPL